MNQSASKLYMREFWAAMAAYVVVLPVSITLIIASPPSAWWRISAGTGSGDPRALRSEGISALF